MSINVHQAMRAWGRVGVRYSRHRHLQRATEPLEIIRLISPLRYDVLVRMKYFIFLEDNLDLFHDDFERYSALALQHPYFQWFRTIAHPRFLQDEDVHRAFRERLRRATQLYLSVREHGFDTGFPIVVASSGHVTRTATGKVLGPRYFPIDGCHRLALLHLTGCRELRPEWYRLKVDPKWSPPDNTHALIKVLGIDAHDYYRFVSRGYVAGGASFDDEGALLRHLEATEPGVVAEVRSVISADRSLVTPPSSPVQDTRLELSSR